MVVKQLENLTEDERELVLLAPALVTVLISGADNDFSKEEEEQAFKAVHFRGILGDQLLFDYYKAVDHSFASSVNHIKQKYEGNADQRGERITQELAKLNDILPKIDKKFAHVLLDNWRSLAKSIAKADGGIFGYGSISYEEGELIGLEMITYS